MNPYFLTPSTLSTGTSPRSAAAAQDVPFDSDTASHAK